MENPVILILYWFENLCLIIMGGVLFNYFSHQNLKLYAKVAVINAVYLYVIRNVFSFLGISLIWHIPFSLLIFIFTLFKIGKLNKVLATITGLIGYTASTFNDITLLSYYINWFHIDVSNISSNIYLHLGLGLIADITYLSIILLAISIKYIYNFRRKSNYELS